MRGNQNPMGVIQVNAFDTSLAGIVPSRIKRFIIHDPNGFRRPVNSVPASTRTLKHVHVLAGRVRDENPSVRRKPHAVRANNAAQNGRGRSLALKARRIPVDQHFAIDMVADCNPGTVATDTDAVGDPEPVLDEDALVCDLEGLPEGKTVRRDGVPVVVADQETVAIRRQLIGIDRSGGQDSCRKQSVSRNSSEWFNAPIAWVVPGHGEAVHANIGSPVTDDDVVVTEKRHAVRLTQAFGLDYREIRQGDLRRCASGIDADREQDESFAKIVEDDQAAVVRGQLDVLGPADSGNDVMHGGRGVIGKASVRHCRVRPVLSVQRPRWWSR